MKKEILTRIPSSIGDVPKIDDIVQVNLPVFPAKSLYLKILEVLETTEDYYFVKAISCDTESEVYDNKPVIPLRRAYTRYFQKLKKKERKKLDEQRTV
jgi:hypothetical protein